MKEDIKHTVSIMLNMLNIIKIIITEIKNIIGGGEDMDQEQLLTKKDIQKGEELLLKYSWYDPTKPNTENNKHYIPLPKEVSIEKRNGKYVLYALEDIEEGFDFGVSHHWYKPSCCFEPNPIGWYLEELNKPNCRLIEDGRDITLESIKKIKKGETISVNYGI